MRPSSKGALRVGNGLETAASPMTLPFLGYLVLDDIGFSTGCFRGIQIALYFLYHVTVGDRAVVLGLPQRMVWNVTLKEIMPECC